MHLTPSFKAYADTAFQQEQATYAAAHPDDSGCEHCQAPFERRARVEARNIMRFSRNFALTWYGFTLIEQTIFRHFPGSHSLWVQNHPVLKIPVSGSGFGCVQVTVPSRLVKYSTINPFVTAFADYYALNIPQILKIYQIDLDEFLTALETDPKFEHQAPCSIDGVIFRALKT